MAFLLDCLQSIDFKRLSDPAAETNLVLMMRLIWKIVLIGEASPWRMEVIMLRLLDALKASNLVAKNFSSCRVGVTSVRCT
jgi:hypothetical protein